MFQVICLSCGNPDFNQDPDTPISPCRVYQVDTIEDASIACQAYIITWGLGGGNWPEDRAGLVTKRRTRKIVARISYNGRIWPEETACNETQSVLASSSM